MFTHVLIQTENKKLFKEYSVKYFEDFCDLSIESIDKFVKSEGFGERGIRLKHVQSYYNMSKLFNLEKSELRYKYIISLYLKE